MHLGRRAVEEPDAHLATFYDRLLAVQRRPEVHEGQWREVFPRPAWEGNPTADRFVAGLWENGDRRVLTVVNFGETQAQCYLPVDVPALQGQKVVLVDLLGEARYERPGSTLRHEGLYLDLPPWGLHVFEVRV
jgi:hypothetical protein